MDPLTPPGGLEHAVATLQATLHLGTFGPSVAVHPYVVLQEVNVDALNLGARAATIHEPPDLNGIPTRV
jgi:hypothetical protein